MQLSLHAKSAFTLIELLIVITLLSILAGISFSSWTSVRRQALLEEAVETTVDLIQNTRSLALNNLTLNTSGNTAEAFYLTIDVATQTLTLYADVPDPASDEVLEEAVLDETVEITVAPLDLIQIQYTPPTADLDLIFPSSTDPALTITLLTITLTSGTSTRTITLHEIAGIPEIVN